MNSPYLIIDRSGNAVDINQTTCHDHLAPTAAARIVRQNHGSTREQMVPDIGLEKDCRNSRNPSAFRHGVHNSLIKRALNSKDTSMDGMMLTINKCLKFG